MNTKEALKIVNLLHSAYPQDKKATPAELFERATTYSVTMADEDYETVEAAALHIIRTSHWYPNPNEILEAVKRVKLDRSSAAITPITTAQPIEDEALNGWLDAFCEWIGFGCEEDETAIARYYEKHPDMREKMKGVFDNAEQ